jgi:shikimate dehydrogenase
MTSGLRLCLVGRGIGGSPSPAMHEAALRACGLEGAYEVRDVAPGELPGLLAELRAGAYLGCNVTIPYKAALAAACDRLEGDAELLGVVNTITVEAGKLIGDNTDADGFELGLSANEMWPKPGSAAIVLGAGGAAAAALLALSRAPAAHIAVAARREAAARALAATMAPVAAVDVLPWDRIALQAAMERVDIVVNATPVGVADLPFSAHDLWMSCTVADVRYRPRPVDLVEAALQSGHRACDGLDMLLYQGLLSFTHWTGCSAPATFVRRALLAAVAG